MVSTRSGHGQSPGVISSSQAVTALAVLGSLVLMHTLGRPWLFAFGTGKWNPLTTRWLMEDLIRIGDIKMGLPGLAALFLFIAPTTDAIPRILRNKDVGKLPLLPFSAMAINQSIWCTYGILGALPAVWMPNAFGIVCGFFYCAVYLYYMPPGADWLPYTSKVHYTVAAAAFKLCFCCYHFFAATTGMAILGTVGNCANIVLFAGPLAAIQTVIKEQNTSSLSFGFTCGVAANCSLWAFYGMMIVNDPQIYISNIGGMILGTIQLSLFFRYGFGSAPRKISDSFDCKA